jgi:23S rRNA (guanosine2251-2'-O)-methyltransferase
LKKESDYIFGTHAVLEAIKTGREVDRVLIARKSDTPVSKELFALVRENEIPWQFVPVEKINRITRKNHQGVLAFLSEISYSPLPEIITRAYESGRDPLLVLLDRVSDVRNFGAIARSAECLGFSGIIVPEKGSARINADAVKTSAGALLKIPVARVSSLANTLKYLKDSGIRIVAATEKTDSLVFQEKYSGPLALVLGNEETGISENLLFLCDDKVRIPMHGDTESLNVSVAASIMMYEVLRQRALVNPGEDDG